MAIFFPRSPGCPGEVEGPGAPEPEGPGLSVGMCLTGEPTTAPEDDGLSTDPFLGGSSGGFDRNGLPIGIAADPP